MLSVLTPTGFRPECFDLLTRYINRQTLESFRWVVVHDGQTQKPKVREGIELVFIENPTEWRPGDNSQARLLLQGLEHCTDTIAIMEDDDWYHQLYLETMLSLLDKADLVGILPVRYYHVPSSTMTKMGNQDYSSLASTAMRGKAIDSFRKALAQPKRIDSRLWRTHGGHLEQIDGLTLGMKGLPGRPGIGIGHKLEGQPTPLHHIIGDDFSHYARWQA